MIRLLTVALVVLGLAACSSGGGQTLSPTSTPAIASPTPTPSPTAKAGDLLFRGVVRAVSRACEVDARCSVTVEVTESLAGGLAVGEVVTVIESYGYSPWQCVGSWDFGLPGGETVEVLAHSETHPIEEPGLAICEDESYYVDVIGQR